MHSTPAASLANDMPRAAHVFRGGCSARRHGSWHWYCLDRVAWDTSAPYFRKASNTCLTSLINIVVNIQLFSIGTSCNWQYHQLHVTGQHWSGAHGHAYSNWKDSHVVDTLRIPRGQWWSIRQLAACGHVATHAYDSRGQWSNFESTFVGTY